jgi:prepilin-type N-terminal cleavage/methylation domain-containing protein
MSLIEVVVAISILGILATASLGVFINGINSASMHQRREVAVTIASQQMESINAMTASTLYSGRTEPIARASLAANLAIPGVSKSYKSWDRSTPVGALTLATTQPVVELSGTKYTVDVVLGACFQPKAGGTCTGDYLTAEPTTVPATSTKLTRVIVVVRWNVGSGCADGGCVYSATSLIDLTNDLDWNVR